MERTQEIQSAMKLLVESDQEEIDQLPKLYREAAEQARERFGNR